MRYQRAESPALLNGHEAARRFFASWFDGEVQSRERLLVAHVDGQTRCLHVEHYVGEAGEVRVPVRDILTDALRIGSAAVVIAHNHSSGNAMPSRADYRATRRLARAGESIDLSVLDHLIFAGTECRSMRRMGLL